MLFIGICGASGSGKSTLAEFLQARLGSDRCFVLQQDAYYLDHPMLTFEERKLLNYDEPDIFDHDELLADVKALMAGQPITRKQYDYALHRRADTTELIQPRDVLILEGIHCFHDERLRDGRDVFGVGLDHNISMASIKGILCAINRGIRLEKAGK